MQRCERTLESQLQRILAIPVTVGVSSHLMPGDLELTPQEQLRYQELIGISRRVSWLAGRAALKRVLGSLGESTDTSELVFPHARVSLTHSGGYAVALGVPRDVRIMGIGIDFETMKQLRPEGDRLFLSSPEQAWIGALRFRHQARERLRLWTAKEALFKANPGNDGTSLMDYRLTNPSTHTGTAIVHDNPAVLLSYSSLYFEEGILTAAVSQSQEVLT